MLITGKRPPVNAEPMNAKPMNAKQLHRLAWPWLALALSLTACSRDPAPSSGSAPKPEASVGASSASAPPPAGLAPLTDGWLGQWNGPEGTFLRITGGRGRYELTLQDLDGPRHYSGRAVDGHIEFERQGRTETIRATDGRATGMKWLDGKQNCLTVRSGEGYCRD